MRRPGSRLIGFGLVLIASALGVNERAQAGIVLGTPIVRSGGDPWYIYDTPIFLDAGFTLNPVASPDGFNPVDPLLDDFFTIYNVRGFFNVIGLFPEPDQVGSPITSVAGIARPAGTGYTPPDQSAPPIDPGYPFLADVSFFVVRGYDPIVNMTENPILLGYLAIQAWLPTGVDPTMDFDYTWQAEKDGNKESGSGSVPVVPEPASFLLICLGATLAGLRGLRSRRSARSAA